MFSRFRLASGDHYLDHGLVGCPLVGKDVDLDKCAGCPWIVEFDDRKPRPVVRCRPPDNEIPSLLIW